MSSTEHAVIVRYRLTGDTFGENSERAAIYALGRRLAEAIETADAGVFDGNEIGGGHVDLYAYGPDASRLFAAMEAELRAFPARPAQATLRFGEPDDPTVSEQQIDL